MRCQALGQPRRRIFRVARLELGPRGGEPAVPLRGAAHHAGPP